MLPTVAMGRHCCGAALFPSGTCQVSACSSVRMLSMCRITSMLWIYKKTHKPGLRFTHYTQLVCTCAGQRLVFPHLNPQSFTHCIRAPTEPPEAQKPQDKGKNIITTVITSIFFLFFFFKASDSKQAKPLGQKKKKKYMPGEIQKLFYGSSTLGS